MAKTGNKLRHVGKAEVMGPRPDNPIVNILASYGIPYDRIYGRRSQGDVFTGDKRFEDYEVYIYGVSSNEELPHPQLAWFEEEKEYACWQIQIYWKDYNARIDAVWWEEYDHYTVMTVWHSLGQLDSQLINAMNKGLKLLRLVSKRMSKAGRPSSGYVTEENKSDVLEKIIETGRRVYKQSGELSQDRIARSMKGLYGINSKRDIYRIVTEIGGLDWKKDILPRIKQP